jgi:hypothetical protein
MWPKLLEAKKPDSENRTWPPIWHYRKSSANHFGYGAQTPETFVPTPELRQQIANGESFIIFYGKITYVDVFGASHWTAFCTGSGSAMGDLRKCLTYNDVDNK